jgi:hypothetical protein
MKPIRKLAATCLLVLAIGMTATPASASPMSYTTTHCVAFAHAMTGGHNHQALRQVMMLTHAPTVMPVRVAAIRFVQNPVQRTLVRLVNSCYQVVVVS